MHFKYTDEWKWNDGKRYIIQPINIKVIVTMLISDKVYFKRLQVIEAFHDDKWANA